MLDDIITQISIGIHLLQHFVLVIVKIEIMVKSNFQLRVATVSYTHLRAHETVLDLVCRLLLDKNKQLPLQPGTPPP